MSVSDPCTTPEMAADAVIVLVPCDLGHLPTHIHDGMW